MKRCRTIVIIVIYCILSLSLFAQEENAKVKNGKWNGDFDIILGNNFRLSPNDKKTNNSGEFKAKIGYESQKFNFEIKTDLPYTHKITGRLGKNYDKVEQDTSLAIDNSSHEYTNIATRSSGSFQWAPNNKNRIRISYQYEHYEDRNNNYNLSTGPISESFDRSYSNEEVHNYGDINNVGFSYQYQFSKLGRILTFDWDGVFTNISNFSETRTGQGTGEIEEGFGDISPDRKYRNTPYSNNNEHNIGISFIEPQFMNVKELILEFGFKAHFCNLYDYSRASTLIGDEWVDSTSIREDFRYRTLVCTPQTKITFNPGKFSLNLTYSPESFSQRLDSKNQSGDIEKGTFAHEIDLISRLDLGKGHNLMFSMARREDRPSYLQMCWFPRHTGAMNANEIYQGNPDLETSIRTSLALTYQYVYKRFTSTIKIDSRLDTRKIESTFNDEIIDDRNYRIYTWVNGGKSYEIKSTIKFSWNSEHFHANLGGFYNVYHGLSSNGTKTFSGNYSIFGNAEYREKTWIFGMSAEYQSDIIRSYTSMTHVIDGNIKISKTFGKHFSAYIEGRNLLDRDVITTLKSEDELNMRIDRNINNKRIFILGVNYHF